MRNDFFHGFNGNGGPQGVLIQDNDAPLAGGLRGYLVWADGSDWVVVGNKVANSTRESDISASGVERINVSGNDLANLNRQSPERGGDSGDTARDTVQLRTSDYSYIGHNVIDTGSIMLARVSGGSAQWSVVEDNDLYGTYVQIGVGADDTRISGNRIQSGGPNTGFFIDGYDTAQFAGREVSRQHCWALPCGGRHFALRAHNPPQSALQNHPGTAQMRSPCLMEGGSEKSHAQPGNAGYNGSGTRFSAMRKTTLPVAVCLLMLLAIAPQAAPAAVHRLRIPLTNGRLTVATLTKGMADLLHLPTLAIHSDVSINLGGLAGALYIKAFNKAVGEGCHIRADGDGVVLEVDPAKLPGTSRQLKQAIRIFTAMAAPRATARQQRAYGLKLPRPLVAGRPLVVLVHGLDCDGSDWADMARLLQSNGYQVAYFRYPNDEALSQSIERFTHAMKSLRDHDPALTVDVVTHSMGALIARGYVEGKQYAGGVRHLILIAPPNHGSAWALLRPLLEWHEHYELWRHNPDWHWTWMITDGLGAAGEDLEPDSEFLKRLNDLDRRHGVRYTIIAGTHTPWQRWGAAGLSKVGDCLPDSVESLWGVRQCRDQLLQWSRDLRAHDSKSDGVVSLKSAELAGVSDLVSLPANHERLYTGTPQNPPAAWATVENRLAE